jgi:hypothetical protein
MSRTAAQIEKQQRQRRRAGSSDAGHRLEVGDVPVTTPEGSVDPYVLSNEFASGFVIETWVCGHQWLRQRRPLAIALTLIQLRQGVA